MKLHFQKKFGKRSPPAVIVVTVKNSNFVQKIESYGTALSNKTNSFRIKKSELLKPISFGQKVEKGDVIAELKSGNIVAPFTGVLGKRGISENTLGSENLLILTLDDTTTIFSDIKIPVERIATKPSKASQVRRVESKKKRSMIKKSRKKVSLDD